MSLVKKYLAKLYLKQWGVGLCQEDIAAVIRNKKSALSFQWLPLPNEKKSIADPFIFTGDGTLKVLYEDFTTDELDGKIALLELDSKFNKLFQKDVLISEHHLSYPFVFNDSGQVYVFPENAFTGSVFCYRWDNADKTLKDRKEVLAFPLIDPTILFHNHKYWLFGTKLDQQKGQDKNLHIFYSNSLFGPYTPHTANPVKSSLNGARPAGNFILVDGEIYRPAQNSENYYGESISICKIKTLTEEIFEEEEYMKIYPDADSKYNKGIHTLNVAGNTIIVDGLQFYFQPVKQLRRWLKKQ